MPITATSSIARIVSSAKSLISNSATFQSRTESANAAAALDHIYLYEHPKDWQDESDAETLDPVEVENNTRPYAIVMLNEGLEFSAVPGYESCVGLNLQLLGGALVVIQSKALYAYQPEGLYEWDESYLDFLNLIGGICDDLSGKLSDTAYGDLYGFRHINMLLEPTRTSRELRSQDDYWTAWLVLSKGGN